MDVDYRLAFDLAPVGLVLSRNRTMVDCNRHVCEMFGASREVLMGQSFQILYPAPMSMNAWAHTWRPSSTPRATTLTTA